MAGEGTIKILGRLTIFFFFFISVRLLIHVLVGLFVKNYFKQIFLHSSELENNKCEPQFSKLFTTTLKIFIKI